ncbi:MAG: FxsA family protein [Deltaproteobacteria bacterium]|nr:FxsA family protein [Deltaproteobacteria bacterium]
MGKLILLFVVVPLVETYLLAHIGAALGWANTIALVIITGVVGGWLAKLEGTRAWHRWREALAAGRLPEEGVLEGLLLLLGGALLITPGVLTDAVGLALLVPWTRRLVAAYLRPRLEERVRDQATTVVEEPQFRVIRFGPEGPAGAWGVDPFDHGPGSREPDPAPLRREIPREADGCVPGREGPRQVIDAEFEVRESDES